MSELRDYQQQAIAEVRAHIKRGVRRVLVQAPTGSGKTILTSHMLGSIGRAKQTGWFIVHRQELLTQSSIKFRDEEIPHGLVMAGYSMQPDNHIQICSIGTLVRRYKNLRKPKYIVWDECFPAETLVDGKPINMLEVGDMVRSFNHATNAVELKRIMHKFKTKPRSMCTVHIADRSILCTESHPFFVIGRGYVEAKSIQAGDLVIALQNMRYACGDKHQVSPRPLSKSGLGILRERMLGEISRDDIGGHHGEHESQVCIGSNALAKSDASGGEQGENARITSSHRSSTKDARREWERHDSTAAIAVGEFAGSRVLGGIHLPDRNSRLRDSDALQDRYSESEYLSCNRDRRVLSYGSFSTSPGQKENGIYGIARVDSVAFHEQTSDGTFAGRAGDGFVYNIEVEDNNNYFVEGILVHNCHHIRANSWQSVFAAFPDAVHIGLSATPCRLDGRGLADCFDVMVRGPSTAQLIAEGYLSPYRLWAPPLDTSALHTRMGDFIQSEVVEKMNTPKIIGDAVDHYERICKDARTIIFCASIDHSERTAAEFRSRGFRAAHVDGETSRDARERSMREFELGKIKILTNVDLFGEGIDVAGIECVILLRPTQSLGLYLQQVGRALRPVYGDSGWGSLLAGPADRRRAIAGGTKPCAFILDHAGNSERHGYPDDDREWSLEGRPARQQSEKNETIRICGACYFANPATSRACGECGTPFPVQSREVAEVEGTLAEVTPEERARAAERTAARMAQGRAKTFEELAAFGRGKGMKKPERWAMHILRARGASLKGIDPRYL
jgi:superfamily II DNA or RNA helicase